MISPFQREFESPLFLNWMYMPYLGVLPSLSPILPLPSPSPWVMPVLLSGWSWKQPIVWLCAEELWGDVRQFHAYTMSFAKCRSCFSSFSLSTLTFTHTCDHAHRDMRLFGNFFFFQILIYYRRLSPNPKTSWSKCILYPVFTILKATPHAQLTPEMMLCLHLIWLGFPETIDLNTVRKDFPMMLHKQTFSLSEITQIKQADCILISLPHILCRCEEMKVYSCKLHPKMLHILS